MRDAENVVVQRAIVHLINHKTKALILSDDELSLKSNKKLGEYFSNQVVNALKDNATGSANYAQEGDHRARDESYRILKSPKNFISSSRELAQLLFEAMGTDERIKPASLAVCVYTASNYDGRFLALIKIDPTEALVERIEKVNGKQIVTFDVRTDVMPTHREKLQKAALIPPEKSVKNLDLLLLDKQVAGLATFFAVKFLNTEPALDPIDSLVRFYGASRNAHNRMIAAPPDTKEHIEPDVADSFTQFIDLVVQRPRVNFEQLFEDSPLSDDAKEVYKEEIRNEFPQETEIRIDKKHAKEKLIKKKRFRGDYGVLFEVDSDHYSDVVTQKTEIVQDGKIITKLVLEVPGLQWVK